MYANHQVNESRPPQDPDSPLSFTMEGNSGTPPASATSFYWSPGWNSAQAINKFRNEVNDGRQDEDTGVRLIESSKENSYDYLECIPVISKVPDKWKLVPLHHIFGSEELSMKSKAISERSPGASFTMNEEQAGNLKIVEGEFVTIISDTVEMSLPVRIESDWPKDHLGISMGYKTTASVELDTMVRLEKSEKKDG